MVEDVEAEDLVERAIAFGGYRLDGLPPKRDVAQIEGPAEKVRLLQVVFDDVGSHDLRGAGACRFDREPAGVGGDIEHPQPVETSQVLF